MIVIDASVVLKWVLPDEPLQREAFSLRRRHAAGGNPLAAPDLLLYEVANVLPMRWQQTSLAVKVLEEVFSIGLYLHSFELPEFAHAMELAHRYRITTYDASYVALAQALHCPFVTTDERLLSRLKGISQITHLKEAVT